MHWIIVGRTRGFVVADRISQALGQLGERRQPVAAPPSCPRPPSSWYRDSYALSTLQRALHATLEQTPSGRVEIDRCAACHGVWFDAGELAMLAQLGNSEAFALQSPLLPATTQVCPAPATRDAHAGAPAAADQGSHGPAGR